MVFFAQKVLRKVAGNWSFVVLFEHVYESRSATGARRERRRAGLGR